MVQELNQHRCLACLCIALLIAVPCFAQNANPNGNKSKASPSVKKELSIKPPVNEEEKPLEIDATKRQGASNAGLKPNISESLKAAVASDVAAMPLAGDNASSATVAQPPAVAPAADADAAAQSPSVAASVPVPFQVEVEESGYRNKIYQEEEEIPDSVRLGFYILLILSSSGIIFIVVKVYRLRLSRAERKYGVQGDRTTQELTPLPISIEDGNSDEEDHTLFEINRQQIRIL